MEPSIRIVAMPKDANPDGDVFGGWILSMMDVAGAIPARKLAKTRVVTVAIDNLQFHLPVFIGDCIECYAHIEKVGNTSITVRVETFVDRREGSGEKLKVTEGRITYVAIDANRNKIKVQR
jgi:acyl-CoA thioesterase YciA